MKLFPLPDVVHSFNPGLLHASTSPAAIARMQRHDVMLALDVLGPNPTPEQIAEVVILPVCTVIVRLKELHGDFSGYPYAVKPKDANDDNTPFNRVVGKNQKRFAGRKKKVVTAWVSEKCYEA